MPGGFLHYFPPEDTQEAMLFQSYCSMRRHGVNLILAESLFGAVLEKTANEWGLGCSTSWFDFCSTSGKQIMQNKSAHGSGHLRNGQIMASMMLWLPGGYVTQSRTPLILCLSLDRNNLILIQEHLYLVWEAVFQNTTRNIHPLHQVIVSNQ